MFCGQCGTEIKENDGFCTVCGREAATRKAVVEKKPRKKVVKKQKVEKLAEYEEDYLKRLEKPRKRVGAKKQKEEQRSYFEKPVEWKSVPLAIILSFIWSGLGHLYISQIKKGIIFLAIGFVLGSLSWFDFLLLIPLVPFWIWVMYDSYMQVKLYNKFVEENGKRPEW